MLLDLAALARRAPSTKSSPFGGNCQGDMNQTGDDDRITFSKHLREKDPGFR